MCIHALAFALPLALAVYRPHLAWLALAVAVSYGWQRRALHLQCKHSVRMLLWHADGRWSWQLRDGTEYQGTLIHAVVPGRFFVLLCLRRQGRRWGTTAVLLAADSLTTDAHRHLRARLTLWSPEHRRHDANRLLRDHLNRVKALVYRQ